MKSVKIKLNNPFNKPDGLFICSDGTKKWRVNGKLHREDGPALERPDGQKEWLIKGKWHREDGPAIEFPNGHKEWRLNDRLHREDGPAIEQVNHFEWWFSGHRYSMGNINEIPYGWDEYLNLMRVLVIMTS